METLFEPDSRPASAACRLWVKMGCHDPMAGSINCSWLISFLMTGTGAAMLLGCVWMPHPARNYVSGYRELKESFFGKNFGIKCWGSGCPPVLADVSMFCDRCLRHILPILRCQRPSKFQGLPGPSTDGIDARDVAPDAFHVLTFLILLYLEI